MERLWVNDHSDEDAAIGDVVNPWVHITPSAATQTGGDWFRLLLAASFGNKSVHGANSSPTCEVLCKATKAQSDDDNYGLLTWDDSIKAPGVLGSHISDQFYCHQPYRGTITASGCILAYESGLWEPSMRRRARSSALLAAGLVVHGMTNVDACKVVEAITSDKIDIQAVDNAIIPASHLKREMVIVSKGNHRIFSQGTLQCGITWFDDKLHTRSGARNMAFDWGRVTTIARYIGEANIQNCKAFRYRAKSAGVPFSVVRNSWAYVSEADYYLPLYMFLPIPKIDLVKYKIPSLEGTFVGHEQEVMFALNRGSKFMDTIPENESFKAYMKLHREARSRHGSRRRVSVPLTSTERSVHIEEHSLTEGDLLALLESGTVIMDSFNKAVASRRYADPDLDDLLKRVAAMSDGKGVDYEVVDKATTMVYDRPTWLLARVIAEGTLKEGDSSPDVDRSYVLDMITSSLGQYKAQLIGYRSSIEVRLYLSASQTEKLRRQTMLIAQRSAEGCKHVTFSQRTLASEQYRTTAQALSNIGEKSDALLKDLRTNVATTVESWYLKVIRDPDELVREKLAYCAYLHVFLTTLTPVTCYQKASGYIEGTTPRQSYVYQGMLRTAADYEFVPPKLKRLTYADAGQIARELDDSKVVPYSVVEAVDRVIELADTIVGDLLVKKVWRPTNRFYEDEVLKYARPLSPPYCGTLMQDAEDECALDQLLEDMAQNLDYIVGAGYDACLNSYRSKELADKIAQANGYPDLHAAFQVLGKDAFYEDNNPFVIRALSTIGLADFRKNPTDGDASSSRKRSYDQVI